MKVSIPGMDPVLLLGELQGVRDQQIAFFTFTSYKAFKLQLSKALLSISNLFRAVWVLGMDLVLLDPELHSLSISVESE